MPPWTRDRPRERTRQAVLAGVLAAVALVVGSAGAAVGQINFQLSECSSGVLDVDLTTPSGDSLLTGNALVEWETSGTAKDLATVDLFVNASGSSKDKVAGDLSGGDYTWDTTTYQDVQDATLAVRAKLDTCQANDSVTGIDVDNTAPSVAVTSPSAGDLLEGDVGISWSTDDDHPDSVDVDVSADGGSTWDDLHDGTDDGSHTWSTASLSEGDDYRVRVRTTDATGSTSPWSATGSFAIDNEAPDATVTSPTGGAVLQGAVTVAWDASDLHLTCVDLEVRPDGGAWSAVAVCSTAGEAVLDTTAWEDGDHEIRVVAFDELDHQTASSPVPVGFDNVVESDPSDDDTTDDTTDNNDDGTDDTTDDTTDDGTDDGTDDTTDDGTDDTDGDGTDTSSSNTSSTDEDRDPGPRTVEALAGVPLPTAIVGIVGAAIAIGATLGLWIRRRQG